jgi:hypothetical protein
VGSYTITVAQGTLAAANYDFATFNPGTLTVVVAVPTVGVYDPSSSMFMLRNTNDSGFANEVCSYGGANAGWLPIVGDWTGDGTESIGLYNPVTSTFYLRNTNDSGCANTVFVYGPANTADEPVVGDWDGNGTDSVGLFDPESSTFYLRNSNCLQGPNDHGYADIVFTYGPANGGMLPMAGDWDGSRKDGIGLYSQATSTFYLRESTQLQGSNDKGYADYTLNYGVPRAGLVPIAGDWNGDGRDGIGLYDQSIATFFLRNTVQLQGPSDQGFADVNFPYGQANHLLLPVAGDWTTAAIPSPIMGGTTETVTGTSIDLGSVTVGKLPLAANVTNAPATINGSVTTGVANVQPGQLAIAAPSGGTGCVTLMGAAPTINLVDATTAATVQPAQLAVGAVLGGTLNIADGSITQLGSAAVGSGSLVDSTSGSDGELTSSGDTPQLPAIDPGAVDRIDLATVAHQEVGQAAGLQDPDSLADDLLSGVLGGDASHTDAALAS